MSFTPNEQDTQQILKLLQESRSPDPARNAAIQQQLDQYNAMLNFNCYLTFILCTLQQQTEEIRSVAGLLLKNNIQNHFATISPSLSYLQPTLLQALLDASKLIRNTTSNCLATITRCGGLSCWMQNNVNLLQCLCQLLDSGNPSGVDGALSTIVKICEDCHEQLDVEAYGRPVNFLVPKLITFFAHPEVSIRKNALHSVVVLLQASNHSSAETGAGTYNAILVNIEPFLQGIFKLANDQSKEVRRDVCKSFIALLDVYGRIKPFIQDIIRYILAQTQDSDESLALDACEFWSAIAEIEVAKQDLQPFINDILPVLLKGMVYSEFDRSMLDADEDASVPDREENIHPHMINKAAKAKLHQTQHGQDNGPGDGSLEEDDDDDDGAEVSEWNLRKCSASSLDMLSNVYGDPLLEVLLPLIQQRMAESQPWEVRESAILALGAIAEGCFAGMRPHLEMLIPYLIGTLSTETKPLVRSITCWTLSRYARWIVSQSVHDHKPLFEPLLKVLLLRLLDNNKRVQEAACSAFATLEEEAQTDLVPYLQPIVECLAACFAKYQKKNLFILYDAVVTLSDAVHRRLNSPELIQVLMPPLLLKWTQIKDDDRALFPLLACLTAVAQAVGPGFQPFAEPIFRRCGHLIQGHFQHKLAAQHNPSMEPPNREFVVCSLDMLSGLADGMGGALEGLVANSNLCELILECLKDEAADVRQSCIALVGDLAKTCMGHLRRHIPALLPVLIQNLRPTPISVCNNSTWAIGEIAVRVEGEMLPWAKQIVDCLVPILNSTQLPNRNLLENTALTLGRLGLVCPDVVAPILGDFVRNWCYHMRHIRNDVEKEQAFLGLCQMIRRNPNGAFVAFAFICDAFASWGVPKSSLKEEFRAILNAFRSNIGDQWGPYYAQFPPSLRCHLTEVYGLV
eukprot:RCo050889